MVAFETAIFSSCFKAHVSGPVKGVAMALKERGVQVYDVNEDYTSQLCNGCHNKIIPKFSGIK